MALEDFIFPRDVVDPLFFHLRVPCVCDYGAFRQGGRHFSDISTADVYESWSQVSKEWRFPIPFLQGWLFFAFLEDTSRICGVDFDSAEFIRETSEGERVITMQALRKYTWFWIAAEHRKTVDQRKADLDQYTENLGIMNRALLGFSMKKGYAQVFDGASVILSIMILADSMSYISRYIFQLGPIKRVFKWHPPSSLLDQVLIDAGWCVGEVENIIRKCPISVSIFLSSIDRRRPDKDHSKCNRIDGCLANQLDEVTYVPSHAPGCDARYCKFIDSPISSIRKTLEEGNIPVVNITYPSGLQDCSIEATSFDIGSQDPALGYVAVSHVWSDGMGNPGANALRSCQLKRIQTRVNQLYGLTDGNHPFWMDTLCVPLNDDIRRLAIARMAKTYMHADKVLVLDSFLEGTSSQENLAQLLVRTTHCDWNTRLWTFQEARLAKECRFQLRDVALTLGDLRDHTSHTNNLHGVSNILRQQNGEKLWQLHYTKDLTSALDSAGDPARGRCNYPGDGPVEKALHHTSAITPQKNMDARGIPAQWGQIRRDMKENASGGKNIASLHTTIRTALLDPVLCYGIDALIRMCGDLNIMGMDRSKDAADGQKRQLTGFKHKPGVLLRDAARGLQGRTTSRIEDETVCLGGLIGLDVLPLLGASVHDRKNPGDILLAQAARMKAFLLMVECLPSSILFWKSPRLRDDGWRWAPQTFLDLQACASMSVKRDGMCTPEGFRATYNGICLKYQSTSIGDKEVGNRNLDKGSRDATMPQRSIQWSALLNITYADEQAQEASGDIHPFRSSWQLVGLRQSLSSAQLPSQQEFWDQFFGQTKNELAIIVDHEGPLDLEGVIVEVLKEEMGIMYCRYLANVSRLRRSKPRIDQVNNPPNKGPAGCLGYWIENQEWCVG